MHFGKSAKHSTCCAKKESRPTCATSAVCNVVNLSLPFFGSLVYDLREDEMDFKSAGVLPVWVLGQEEDRAGVRALGDQVRIALEMSGLTVEWSGDSDHAILVMA